MFRNIEYEMAKWFEDKNRKPLIIRGPRQVGKTYIAKKFSQEHWKTAIYLNLLASQEDKEIFENIESFNSFKVFFKEKYKIENWEETIIIIDEIQEAPSAISLLKTWNEDSSLPNNLIATGSYLESELKISYPVGQVEHLNLSPLTFDEFILNTKGIDSVNRIKDTYTRKQKLDENFHNEYIKLYKDYLYIGGMPEVVKLYIENNFKIGHYINNTLNNIYDSYLADISKYAIRENRNLIRSIYESIPKQLNNVYNKFKYTNVRKGLKSRDAINEIFWLNLQRLSIPVKKVKKPRIPLLTYVDESHFKLYMSDVGILRNALALTYENVHNDNFSYVGFINENVVAILLNAFNNNVYQGGSNIFYWYNEPYEVDFVVNSKYGIIPIEIKSGKKRRGTSLQKYKNLFEPNKSIVISSSNFSFGNKEINIPLYASFLLKDLINLI